MRSRPQTSPAGGIVKQTARGSTGVGGTVGERLKAKKFKMLVKCLMFLGVVGFWVEGVEGVGVPVFLNALQL